MTAPRPERLDHTDLRAEVAAVREADDLYRVYRPEWIFMWTETGDTVGPLVDKVRGYFEVTFAGRVRDEDVCIEVTGDDRFLVRLKLRLPNLKGEFKYLPAARKFIRDEGWTDAVVVARNSRADHQLRSYGIRKLAGARGGGGTNSS